MKAKALEKISTVGNIAADQQGFENVYEFLNSVFHFKQIFFILKSASILTVIAGVIENYLGIKPIVFVCIIVMFSLEMGTGIAVARRNADYQSHLMPRGAVKLFVYFTFIGCSHLFALHLPAMAFPILGWEFNPYILLFYFFLNWTILTLFVSNIENFKKLGWDEYVPILGKIHSLLKLKIKNPLNKNDEDKQL